MQVSGEAASVEEAIARVGHNPPDVVLLDVAMPGRSGLDALSEISAAAPKTKVLILSMQDDPAYVRRALAAGADGYLLKDAADAELVTAIRQVHEGQRYVHPVVGAPLAPPTAFGTSSELDDALSAREREVLRLLSRGYMNHEIGELLGLSVRTVETSRARLGRKLGLKTRAEIARYALAAGDLQSLPPA
jgi:two-component system response regulator NreC